MRYAVLSGGTGPHVQDVLRAGREAGIALDYLDFRRLTSHSLLGLSGCLIRTMPAGSLEQIVFRMDLLHEAQAAGVCVWNAPRALEACVNKQLTTQRLLRAGLPTPRTITCQTTDDAMAAFQALGGSVVLKPLFGAEGRGMLRLDQPDLAWRVFRAIEGTGGVLYLQEYLEHDGWDLRVLVLNGRVLGGMRRTRQRDWRTNIAQGGHAELYPVGPGEADLALRAAAAVGADFAGVDLLPWPQNPSGWSCLEVNGVPGWAAFQQVTGIDVARAWVDALLHRVTS